ncbi:MAG: hypothetical protein J0L69_07410 [Bacteroidetes bacterium]|nr:hypothetical protein [Bacteroidota bacterium]
MNFEVLDINKKYSFRTIKGILSLILLSSVEPNNGRMLYEVSLMLDDKDVTATYFENWPHINFNLNNYNPMSADGNWIYIPKEGDHFLINSQTLDKSILPYLSFSAATFIGNYFIDNSLIVLSYDEVIQKDLINKTTKKIKKPSNNLSFQSIQFENNNTAKLMFSDGSQKSVDLDTLEYQ